MANRIIQRHDTAANWSRYNPILAEGELGFVTDQSNRYKIGDGITAWNNLPLQGFNGNVVNELGNDEGSVLSQKFATEKLTELESKTLKFKNISTKAEALRIISAIVDCRIWTKQEFREVGISAFGVFSGKFVVFVSTSSGVFLGQIEITNDGNYPSSGVVLYSGKPIEGNGNFYIAVTIDWSKYDGSSIATQTPIFEMVNVGVINDDSYLLHLNTLSSKIKEDTEAKIKVISEVESIHNLSEPYTNLLNVDSVNCIDGATLTANGSTMSFEGYKTSDYIRVKPNTLYSYGCNYAYLPLGIIYDENKVKIGTFGDVTEALKVSNFTTPSTATYVRWTIDKARGKWFINEGEYYEYNPYESVLSPSKVRKPISSYMISEFNKSENLFNKNSVIADYYIDSNGNAAAIVGQNYNISDWIEVEPNETYTIYTGPSALENSAIYDQYKKKIRTFSEYTQNNFKTIVTDSNARYIRMSVLTNQLATRMVYKGGEQKKSYPHKALVGLANMSLPKSIIVVSKDGRGDYTTINDAIRAAHSGSLNNEVDIIILEGEYKEVIDIRYNWINLIGINREKCIIYYDNGNYGTHFPINMGGHNMLRNLTIKSLSPSDESTITSGMAYAIHFDCPGEGVSILENCTLESELNSAFGVGMHSNQTLICRNCEFKGLRDVKGSSIVNAGMLFHNVQGNEGVNQKAIFENCTFYSKRWVGITLSDVSDGVTDCVMDFRNCIVASDSASWNGKIETNPEPIDASCICGNMKKGVTSYNNNISALNFL